MTPRVFFYAQSLLGIGHLVRSSRIAAALARHGLSVDLVLGGMPVEGIAPAGVRLLQLPPLRASSPRFEALVTETGAVADDADLAERRDRLLRGFADARPDIVLIEAYPFARRQMQFELAPLLEAALARSPRPRVVSSVRDILQHQPNPERRRAALVIVRQAFDAVLVHGDPNFARLEETFPEAIEMVDRIHYTGLVGPPGPCASTEAPSAVAPPADIVVTAGGGAVGDALLRAAIAAKPLTAVANLRWLLVTGPAMPPDRARAIASEAAASGLAVATFVDLPAVLRGARLAVSQAGYNTAADLLAANCRAVLVPFAEGRETEQADRARRLADRGLVVMLPGDRLSPVGLAEAIDRARTLPDLASHGLALDGANETARLLLRVAASPSNVPAVGGISSVA